MVVDENEAHYIGSIILTNQKQREGGILNRSSSSSVQLQISKGNSIRSLAFQSRLEANPFSRLKNAMLSANQTNK